MTLHHSIIRNDKITTQIIYYKSTAQQTTVIPYSVGRKVIRARTEPEYAHVRLEPG